MLRLKILLEKFLEAHKTCCSGGTPILAVADGTVIIANNTNHGTVASASLSRYSMRVDMSHFMPIVPQSPSELGRRS